jgi:uncharacterized protein (DUF169 family)
MQVQKVISVGGNPELLWLRNAVLKCEGFDVSTILSHEDALEAIRQGDCGTLLMCYSLARSFRQLLAEAFRQHCPGGRIVAVTNEQMEKPEFADSFVYGVEGPEALIEAIRQRETSAGA